VSVSEEGEGVVGVMLWARKCSRVGRVIVMEMRSIPSGGWVSFGRVLVGWIVVRCEKGLKSWFRPEVEVVKRWFGLGR